jgi:acetamidase/formamidase
MSAEVQPQHVIGSSIAEPAGAPGEDPPHIHRVIDNSIPAELTIASGETVAFECPGMPLPPKATVEDIPRIDPERPHTFVGPVEVADAYKGGQTLFSFG